MCFYIEAVCYCSENSSKKKKNEDNLRLFLRLYSSGVVASRELFKNVLKQSGKVNIFSFYSKSFELFLTMHFFSVYWQFQWFYIKILWQCLM